MKCCKNAAEVPCLPQGYHCGSVSHYQWGKVTLCSGDWQTWLFGRKKSIAYLSVKMFFRPVIAKTWHILIVQGSGVYLHAWGLQREKTQVIFLFRPVVRRTFQGALAKNEMFPSVHLCSFSSLYESQYTHAITQKYFVNRHIQSTLWATGEPWESVQCF